MTIDDVPFSYLKPEVTFTVPGAPRGKGRPRFSNGPKGPGVHTDEQTASYESLVAWCAKIAMGARKPLSGALTVRIIAEMPIPKSLSKRKRAEAIQGLLLPTSKPDIDNVIKTLDGANKILWGDDAQIQTIEACKIYSETPQMRVSVLSFNPPGDA